MMITVPVASERTVIRRMVDFGWMARIVLHASKKALRIEEDEG
jgi:hypothetical protein